MNTVVIPKTEYKKILERQENLTTKVSFLESKVRELEQDEFSPAYLKRLAKIQKQIDQGKVKRFKTAYAALRYLDRL